MENYPLIVAISPDAIPDRWFHPGNRPVRWVYFGKNVLTMIRLQKNLDGNFSELDISRSLEAVAEKIRSEHVAWIDTINRKYGADIRWWFGNVSSRNIYSSDLFLYCCYLVLLEQIWESPMGKPSLIVVDSPGLVSAICQWAQKKGIRVSIRWGYKRYTKKLADVARFSLRWLDFVVTTCMRKLASVSIETKDIPKKSQACDMVMISTFIHDSSLSEAGDFKDRYFPGLYEYLGKNNKTILIHPVFHGFGYNFFPVFKRISRSTIDFIIPEKYLKIQDYLRAWFYPSHLLIQKIPVSDFRGFELNDTIREEQINGDLQNTLQALMTFYLVKRLKNRELRVYTLIDWYENQALDRAIVAGMRDAYPKTKTLGAQIFLHYPNSLSLFPSRSEVEAGIVPDILLTTSRYQCRLTKIFASSLHCIPAAALRYKHVFGEEDPRECGKATHHKRVLVLTSGIRDETLELLILMLDIMKRLGKDIGIHVHLHPDLRIEEMLKMLPELRTDCRIELVQGSLSDEIREASVVVSKSSGAIVEAVAKGTPAIFVANRNKLNLNPMTDIVTPLLMECYSVDEVVDATQKYIDTPDSVRREYLELGRSIRDQFFIQMNDDTLSPFLGP